MAEEEVTIAIKSSADTAGIEKADTAIKGLTNSNEASSVSLHKGRQAAMMAAGSIGQVTQAMSNAGPAATIFSGALQPMRVMAFFSTARVVSASFSRASSTGFSSPLMRQAA